MPSCRRRRRAGCAGIHTDGPDGTMKNARASSLLELCCMHACIMAQIIVPSDRRSMIPVSPDRPRTMDHVRFPDPRLWSLESLDRNSGQIPSGGPGGRAGNGLRPFCQPAPRDGYTPARPAPKRSARGASVQAGSLYSLWCMDRRPSSS